VKAGRLNVDRALPRDWLDREAPQTRITLQRTRRATTPSARPQRNRVSFRFRSDERYTFFQCRTRSEAWHDCSSGWYGELTRRRQRPGFSVRAVDLAGNADPTPDHVGAAEYSRPR
jgi:hypothetical protein